MRLLVWLLRAFIFFSLFAFSLNNQQTASVHWFFGYAWSAPMVIIVLAAFGAGAVFGVLAMTPAWWRHRRLAKLRTRPATATGPDNKSPAVNDAPAPLPDGI